MPDVAATSEQGHHLVKLSAAGGATVALSGGAEVVSVDVDAGSAESINWGFAGRARHGRAVDPKQEQALFVQFAQQLSRGL
jgi:hypothetical protein